MAIFTAYNQWLDDDWGFASDNRLIAPAMLSLRDPVLAAAELDAS